jgi:hypothetical protein
MPSLASPKGGALASWPYRQGEHANVAISALSAQRRLAPIADGDLRRAGYDAFAWVRADEHFDGAPICAARRYPHGAFLYRRRASHAQPAMDSADARRSSTDSLWREPATPLAQQLPLDSSQPVRTSVDEDDVRDIPQLGGLTSMPASSNGQCSASGRPANGTYSDVQTANEQWDSEENCEEQYELQLYILEPATRAQFQFHFQRRQRAQPDPNRRSSHWIGDGRASGRDSFDAERANTLSAAMQGVREKSIAAQKVVLEASRVARLSSVEATAEPLRVRVLGHCRRAGAIGAYLLLGVLFYRFAEEHPLVRPRSRVHANCTAAAVTVANQSAAHAPAAWTYTEALYFSVVTISTVGYGDLAPSSSGSQGTPDQEPTHPRVCLGRRWMSVVGVRTCDGSLHRPVYPLRSRCHLWPRQ